MAGAKREDQLGRKPKNENMFAGQGRRSKSNQRSEAAELRYCR